MNSDPSTYVIDKSRYGPWRKRLLATLLLCFSGFNQNAAASDLRTLHEVIRHFEVAFVDRPSLVGLLVGGLDGLRKHVPESVVVFRAYPDLFEVRAKNKVIKISRRAIHDYKLLELALKKAARLMIDQKLVSDPKKLEHAIIRQMVAFCGDPWSVFIDSDLYLRIMDDGSKEMGSLGMLVEKHGMGLRVLDVEPSGPAFGSGIRIRMTVDSIARRPASNLNELEALALMRGKPGRKVHLVVEGKSRLLTLAKEPKHNIVVDELAGGIARVHLLNFRSGTARRFASVLSKLKRTTRLKGLILDLRGNPGGLVGEGTGVVGLFIKGGKVVSVINRKQMRTEVEQSLTPGKYKDLPLVVLVDHRSASVSEIVAMALRDYKRALIVGDKTLGKGTVQVIIELRSGAALKLSTGRYYSPNGTPLYEGIEPDKACFWDHTGEDLQLRMARKVLESTL